ncbi:MAG TPA: hypothetical protein VFL86_16015 [Burkholderiaceae bacterium]|nr:hypothetical protein [Burkholderiaceae bacterium]
MLPAFIALLPQLWVLFMMASMMTHNFAMMSFQCAPVHLGLAAEGSGQRAGALGSGRK